ncbi:DAK2 domain-containing protein [Zongyangia hominis]|uniref:DAK2 domain-containing protein n=1 Tax=Zongyangia hominis TaxID=2763677 RepID=A0A926EFP6_9FIRM|nr:DAK2 domain-containing protein [Zongyangia hominis]MBC8570837.1 DAK2 domain-containing protein [Zongyangia hominis]
MITGQILRDAFISASNHIVNQKQQVDELNVFPVPDGDTGTNMSMTISAAARELSVMEHPGGVGEVAAVASSALLRGARGNSGVILSLLFRGISKGLTGKKEADGKDLAAALAKGVQAAYKAVMKPTEGTILTVARMAAEHADKVAAENDDPVFVWNEICTSAEDALAQTPEMLPVLKKAGVVDAGGRGLVVIFEGMKSVFQDGVIIPSQEEKEAASAKSGTSSAIGDYEGEITHTYCTEFIVHKANGNDPLALRAYLESIGDCVVVVDDDDIIKVHVHTDNPGKALQHALGFGMLANIKIDNMRLQFEGKKAAAQKEQQEDTYLPVDPDTPYGFVAVAAGEGVSQLFTDLGVNKVVSGGQTMNPSTDDILHAIHAVPAQCVFVLPNNKNIIMAAEQTIKLADRKVIVLQTRSIPQGVAAMLAFDPDLTAQENQLSMMKAYEKVGTGLITFAARDSDYDGHNIHKGDLLAMENGKLTFTDRDLTRAVTKLTRALIHRDSSFVTLFYGEDVADEQAEETLGVLKTKLPDDIEITLINGGQPVYYYMISVE